LFHILIKIKDDILYSLLIVDDEEIILSGLEEYIDWTALDFNHVYTAGSADEALDILREKDVDIVLTDIRMPVHDGLYLTERIKNEYEDIKVLILSGFNDFEYAKGAIHLGVEDYLLKPVDFNELTKSVIIMLKKIEEEKTIRQLKEEFHSHKIDQFFNDLIFGNTQNKTSGSMAVVMPRGNFFVVRMMILDKGILSEYKEKLKRSITNATKKLSEISAYYLFNNMAQELTMVVYSQSEKILDELASAILSRISFSVVLGASSQKGSLSHISGAYDEAGDAINYQYVDNKSHIIFYSRLKKTYFKSISENTQIRKCVLELLPQGRHKLSMYLDSILDKYKSGLGVDPRIYGELVRAYICIYNYYLRLDEEWKIRSKPATDSG
jgi:two-component system, response regulator YesN